MDRVERVALTSRETNVQALFLSRLDRRSLPKLRLSTSFLEFNTQFFVASIHVYSLHPSMRGSPSHSFMLRRLLKSRWLWSKPTLRTDSKKCSFSYTSLTIYFQPHSKPSFDSRIRRAEGTLIAGTNSPIAPTGIAFCLEQYNYDSLLWVLRTKFATNQIASLLPVYLTTVMHLSKRLVFIATVLAGRTYVTAETHTVIFNNRSVL